MTSQVTESLAVAAAATAPTKTAAQLISQSGVEPKEGLATPSDGESGDDSPYYHQHIERKGQQVLVSWTKEEEKKVVRKADFLFLPLFAVRWSFPFQIVYLGVVGTNCRLLVDVYVDGYRPDQRLGRSDLDVPQGHRHDARPGQHGCLAALVWNRASRDPVKCNETLFISIYPPINPPFPFPFSFNMTIMPTTTKTQLTPARTPTDRPPPRRPTLLDPAAGHRMGRPRGAADASAQRERLVRGAPVPGARRERLHPRQPVRAVALVHAPRAGVADYDFLLRAFRVGRLWVAD